MPAMYSTWFSCRLPAGIGSGGCVRRWRHRLVPSLSRMRNGCGQEVGHVRDVGQDPGGPGRPDVVDVHQVRPERVDRCLQLDLHRLELDVEAAEVGKFLGGHPPPKVPTWQGCWNVSESVRSRPGHRSPFGDRDGKRSRNTSSIAELRTSAGLRSGAKRRPAWHTGFDRSRALPPKHADDRYHAARGRPLACVGDGHLPFRENA